MRNSNGKLHTRLYVRSALIFIYSKIQVFRGQRQDPPRRLISLESRRDSPSDPPRRASRSSTPSSRKSRKHPPAAEGSYQRAATSSSATSSSPSTANRYAATTITCLFSRSARSATASRSPCAAAKTRKRWTSPCRSPSEQQGLEMDRPGGLSHRHRRDPVHSGLTPGGGREGPPAGLRRAGQEGSVSRRP